MASDNDRLRSELEDYLIREADLLDSGKVDGWLDLFTDDCTYWVPCSPHDDDPTQKTAIVHDDRSGLEDRVWRLTSPSAHSQRPRSRTVHLVGNVRIVSRNGEAVVVRSNLMVAEARLGEQRTFAAHCEYHLRRHGESWKIARKKVELLTGDFPIRNLTFLI